MIRTVIIDDERTTEDIIRFFATQGNLPLDIVGSASNGADGVLLIKKTNPDLVFLDIQMPLMNGFEVMRALPDYHYVIVTAFDSFEYAQQALRQGAADILLKPIDRTQLEQSIKRAVNWSFSGNETVDRIAHYLREHYREPISLPDLSQAFFLTESHMARLFKKYTGESVLTYLNHVRVVKARELLDAGTGIQNAADAVGYSSLNNFYKYFKRFLGTTPAAYVHKNKA